MPGLVSLQSLSIGKNMYVVPHTWVAEKAYHLPLLRADSMDLLGLVSSQQLIHIPELRKWKLGFHF